LLLCVAHSPDVELDGLSKAVAALPHALRVGKATLEMDADDIYHIYHCIQQSCADNLSDSQVATHHAIITACALQVSV